MSSQLSFRAFCNLFGRDRHQALVLELVQRHGWLGIRAHQAVTQYQKFLFLAALHRGTHLVPTREIDCVWEIDILQNTWRYITTCQQLCSGIIHHASTAELGKAFPGSSIQQAFVQTQSLFIQQFNQPLEQPCSPAQNVAAADSPLPPSHAAACGVLLETDQRHRGQPKADNLPLADQKS